ncbi:hypothetical protein BTO32_14925 [Marinobacter lutaoensis]|uniref:Uncharacterized protein n=1 Tax=Marinobacter lutaoensis TaxID=135739 RepID=A0A1V2DPE2_9GAMM|nr:hypothetical protein [Marinobacter lutaoensis]ONF42504.1 hypothetical protein BTO32_14925 [Marinobacter lutaoensis]
MNTRIELLYRSASAKEWLTVILPGAITQQQVNTISDSLTMDTCFIPAQVGLPSPLEESIRQGELSGVTEDDHVWTSLEDWLEGTPNAEDLHTEEPPTIELPVEEFADRVSTAKWDLVKEHRRMEMPDFGVILARIEATETDEMRLEMLDATARTDNLRES